VKTQDCGRSLTELKVSILFTQKMDKEKESPNMYAGEDVKASSRKRNPLKKIVIIIIAIIIILALTLGLGLGLGLKHHKASPSTQNEDSDSLASSNVQSWRESTESYALDFTNWNINAPPTTRIYNFTIGQTQIAPDGKIIDLPVM
jgi:flagellar basal body-associated protein FliL